MLWSFKSFSLPCARDGSSPRQAQPSSSPTPRTPVPFRCRGFPGLPSRPRRPPSGSRSAPLREAAAAPWLTHLERRRARRGAQRRGRRGAAPPAPPSRSRVRGEPRPSRRRGYGIPHRERRPLPHARLRPTAASSPRSYRLLAAGRPSRRRRSPAPARSARAPPPAVRGRHPPPPPQPGTPSRPRPPRAERAGGRPAGPGSPRLRRRWLRQPGTGRFVLPRGANATVKSAPEADAKQLPKPQPSRVSSPSDSDNTAANPLARREGL